MAFLQARRASFQRLASSEFHQTLSFLQSDFRIGQAASYDLVITEWTLFASTSMSSVEEGNGGKIRACNFISKSSTLPKSLTSFVVNSWEIITTSTGS